MFDEPDRDPHVDLADGDHLAYVEQGEGPAVLRLHGAVLARPEAFDSAVLPFLAA